LKDTPTLVTGGAGFIGSHLVDALVAAGARVRVLDNFATGKRQNLEAYDGRIELVQGDLRDLATCQRCCQGVRFIFHQAALGSVPRSVEDPATSIAVNIGGMANLLSAARDAAVSRIVYASSSSVYGDNEELPKREGSEGEALSPYALTKTVNEELAQVFSRCYDMQLIGLRYFNVFGARQDPEGPYAAVIPRFAMAYLEGRAPIIHGDGLQSRDFTYVADVVQANLLAAGAPRAACGRAYNIAAGRRTTVLELAELIGQALGGGPAPAHEESRPGDVRHSVADPSAAREHLGFRAQTSIADGLAITLESLRQEVGARKQTATLG
jgi:nucleoside-diphosphate-sugar epimerase